MKRNKFPLFAYLFYLSASLAGPVVINKTSAPSGTQMVLIGDAKNQTDAQNHGRVEMDFSMGAYEWTVADWKAMLDDLASKVDPFYLIADPHELWNEGMKRWIVRTGTAREGYHYEIGSGAKNLPITNVNFFDICRACNYIQNKAMLPLSEGESFDLITEHGAYEITTHSNHSQEITMTEKPRYFIPTQDQWTKAAYYKGGGTDAGYWMYPTQHDNNPGDREGPIKENRANYNLYYLYPWAPSLQLSPVNYCGGFDDQGNAVGTRSAYGCFDMAGNVNEWTATQDESTADLLVVGGDYTSEYYMEPGANYRDLTKNDHLLRTAPPQHFNPKTRSDLIGFRMAAAEDAANIISSENGFGEANNSNWWDNRTTGEQAAGIAGAVIGTAAAAAGAWIAWVYATTGEGVLAGGAGAVAESGEDELLLRKANEFVSIVNNRNIIIETCYITTEEKILAQWCMNEARWRCTNITVERALQIIKEYKAEQTNRSIWSCLENDGPWSRIVKNSM